MLNEEGSFYSALNADSEGVEDKFYTWSKAEVAQILGQHTEIFVGFIT